MVTVIDYAVRQNSEGEEFVALIIQGDLDIVESRSSGRLYATAYQTSITSTFSEEVAALMVGKKLPGQIKRIACDPYDYTVPETGEVIQITHTYEYAQDDNIAKEHAPVFEETPQMVTA